MWNTLVVTEVEGEGEADILGSMHVETVILITTRNCLNVAEVGLVWFSLLFMKVTWYIAQTTCIHGKEESNTQPFKAHQSLT